MIHVPGEHLKDVHDQRVEDVTVPLPERVQAIEYNQLRVVVGLLHDQIDITRRGGYERVSQMIQRMP